MGHHFSGLSESDGLMILPECVVVLNYLASLSIRKYTKEFQWMFQGRPIYSIFQHTKKLLIKWLKSKFEDSKVVHPTPK